MLSSSLTFTMPTPMPAAGAAHAARDGESSSACELTRASPSPKRHCGEYLPALYMPEPATVTTVPPSSGPERGVMPVSRTGTYSKSALLVEKSTRLLETATVTNPLEPGGSKHMTASLPTSVAAETRSPNLHCSRPRLAARAEKPSP